MIGFFRGDKFAAYRMLPSLQDYVLVDIPSRQVETFRRTPEQDWLFHAYLSGCGDCHFATLAVSIPFDEIFENVAPETPETTEPTADPMPRSPR